MLEFLSLKQEAFGLDLSDLSLKILKLKKKGGIFSLASFGESPIPPGLIERGEIKDEKPLIKILKESIKKIKGEKLKTRYVVLSLPEEKTFLQVIQMPKMSEEELKKAVLYEAENYIPLPIKEVYFDSQIVPPVVDKLDHLDVLIAALPKKIAAPYISLMKKTGLIIKALEIESSAVSRALIKNGMSPVPVLLMDLGATRTSFIVFSGFALRFTTSLPISGQGFSQLIAKTLNLNLAKAEKLKIKYGLTKKGKEGKKVFEALIPVLTDLIEQIKKYLAFYQTHAKHEHLPPDGRGVQRILLCGGGANLKGLDQFLSLELKLPVELGNPWINILPAPLKEVPELPFEKSLGFSTALGLALRGIEEK
jgi:type IV pilus assembly protein PilM